VDLFNYIFLSIYIERRAVILGYGEADAEGIEKLRRYSISITRCTSRDSVY